MNFRKSITTLGLVIVLFVASFSFSAPAQARNTFKGFQMGYKENGRYVEQDVRDMINLGSTMIRLPIYFSNPNCRSVRDPNCKVFNQDGSPNPSWPYTTLDDWYPFIDAALKARRDAGKERDVVFVLNFHSMRRQDSNVAPIGEREFINKWRAVARRYRNEPKIWYDLLNEPGYSGWRDDALKAAQVIRQEDQRHRIVVAAKGVTTQNASRTNKLPNISKQALTFHFYNWQRTIQDSESTAFQFPYPNRSRRQTARRLRQLLREVKQAGDRNGVPVYIGEVAINKDHPNANIFLQDFTSICDELGIHLTLHAFREADVWNYEQSPQAWPVVTNWLARR